MGCFDSFGPLSLDETADGAANALSEIGPRVDRKQKSIAQNGAPILVDLRTRGMESAI